jgi:hypothetical protein
MQQLHIGKSRQIDAKSIMVSAQQNAIKEERSDDASSEVQGAQS